MKGSRNRIKKNSRLREQSDTCGRSLRDGVTNIQLGGGGGVGCKVGARRGSFHGGPEACSLRKAISFLLQIGSYRINFVNQSAKLNQRHTFKN